jgi:hypothetical protein
MKSYLRLSIAILLFKKQMFLLQKKYELACYCAWAIDYISKILKEHK